jgi:hypothetical protein
MRLKEKLLTSLLLVPLAGTTAVAKERENFDAFLSRQDSRSLVASEAVIQSRGLRVESSEERLGVPTVLWNARGEEQRTGALAGQRPEQAARAHLEQVADLYRLTRDDISNAILQNVHQAEFGPVVASFGQKINGVEVFRGDINVVMTRENDLVAITGNLAPREAVSTASRATFQLAPADAIARAFSNLTDTVISGRSLVATGTKGDYSQFGFEPGVGTVLPHSLGAPAVAKKVFFTLPDSLQPAYYVEINTGTKGSNDADYYSYVISATDGAVLFRNNLTVQDSFTYNVWADPTTFIPFDGPQGTEATPHPTGTPDRYQAPFVPHNVITLQNFPYSQNDPWLPNGATQTTGNNADAYADLAAPDGFQAGSADIRPSTTSPGKFDYTYDVTKAPGFSPNQIKAATAHLFYLNNFLHDWFYDSGFNEASGNAQVSNYGRGGLEGDSIRAEAQDNSGRNNANMSTPADGSRPRMQMYIFNGVPSLQAVAPASVAGNLEAGSSSFGAQVFDFTGDVLIPNPAGATLACDPFPAGTDYTGKIVLLDRGTCSFNIKVKNAQLAGAVGAIVANNALNQPAPGLGGTDATVTIPSLGVSKETGDAWKAEVATNSSTINIKMKRTPDLDRDGTIDNQIVAHEWGHYLSNRLVGNANGLTNNQGRAMGEGWADFTAMLMTVKESDRNIAGNNTYQGVYAMAGYTQSGGANNGLYYGIRRLPLSTDTNKNNLSYRHFANSNPLPTNHPISTNAANGVGNSQVHNGGEVWSTMLWECYASLLNAYPFQEAQNRMKAYLVAGFKATPNAPTLLEARDAILAAAAAADPADYQRFLNAFAKRGAGLGAKAADRDSVDHIGVVESFANGSNLEVVSMRLDDSAAGCDRDNVLDKGETGMLHVTVRNTGRNALGAFTGTLTANGTTATVAFPNGNTLNIPALQPGATATASARVQLTDVTGTAPTAGLTVTFNEGSLPVSAQTAVYDRRVHYDEATASSATETFETDATGWTSSPANRWVTTTSGSSRYIHVNNLPVISDMIYVSPWMKVGAAGDFILSYKYRHSLEGTAGGAGLAAPFYDGVVLEITTDGLTWDNAQTKYGLTTTALGYNASALAVGDNPLGGKLAYTGLSAGFPAWATGTANFKAALADRDIRVRFRIGSDSAASAYGFDLDDVTVTNAASTPFAAVLPETSDGSTCNRRPVADIGQTGLSFPERTTVTLNGSGSIDPDGTALTYQWTQVSGPAVQLTNANTAIATFTTDVARNTVFGFQLVVSDGMDSSLPKITEVLVTNVNRKPVAMPQAPATVPERSGDVTLNGAGSTDADGETLTYAWRQLSGPTVTLSSATVASPTFTPPEVTADTQLSFELVVNDGLENSAAQTVAVTVTNVDRAPTANAGPDAEVNARDIVTLQGSGSDADGDAITYAWTVLTAPQGSTITLSDATSATPSFTAPDVRSATPAIVVLQLVTTANGMSSTADTVTLTVKKSNRRPVGKGPADFTENENTAITLDATSSSDPDGDVLTYAWTQTGGPLVTLAGQNTATLQFTTPEVGVETLMTFVLVVTDPDGAKSDPVPVSVTVRHVNKVPVANAGPDAEVNARDTVTLQGSGSDPDGSPVTYAWTVLSAPQGTTIILSDATSATPSFTAPDVRSATPEIVVLQLVTSSDGQSSTADTVTVTVKKANRRPVGQGPANFDENENTAITLDATSSSDPDGDALTYAWTQTGGPLVTLTGQNTATLQFTTPEVSANTLMSFVLVVTDSEGAVADPVPVSIRVLRVDKAPVANAGPDAEVNARDTVVLQGSGSDADGDAITYAWTVAQAPQGTTITLNDANTATPSFTAPDVRSATPATLVLQLVTTANGLSSTPDTVTLTVKKANRRPVGQGPATFTENENTAITLDATSSSDPDGDVLTYAWTQTGGPLVTATGQNTAKLQLTTPEVNANTLMTFVLVVKDAEGAEADPVPVSVTVRQVNKGPAVSPRKQVAAALDDKTVTLVAGATDPDGDQLTYKWEQTKGASQVTLSSTTTPTVTFELPAVESTTQLVFKVTATDPAGMSSSGEVEVMAIGTPKPTEDDGGGCSSTGNASGGLMLIAALAGVLLSRRRGVIG